MRTTTRSLAVACALKDLTYDQASDVLYMQDRYKWLRGRKPAALELAADLEYMPQQRIDTILEQQNVYRKDKRPCPDPVTRSLWGKYRAPTLRARLGALGGLLVLTSVMVAALTTSFDPPKILIVVGLVGPIVGSLLDLLGRQTTLRLRLRGTLLALYSVAPVIAMLYCVYQTIYLADIIAGTATAATAGLPWPRWVFGVSPAHLLGGVIVLGCLSVSFFGWGWLSRRQIFASETRLAELRTLAGTTVERGRSSSQVAGTPTEEYEAFVGQVLKRALDVLRANLLARIAGSVIFWNRAAKVASVWYLEPAASGKNFDIKAHAVSDVPENAARLFERIKTNHHPVRMNEERYREVVDLSREIANNEGKEWREVFLRQVDRHFYVSLTGYVFAKCVDLFSDNADDCCVFDRHLIDALEEKDKDKKSLRWVDFRSLAAFPILATRPSGSESVGVLVAFRNMRGTLSRDDVKALSTLARSLGRAFPCNGAQP